MSDSFPRTIRALQKDGMNPTVLGLILITALIAVWCCWLVLGRLVIYEKSITARLEAERVHPVAATVSGRIVASHLSLARHVRRGDVLLEIEADREWLETTEEQTRVATLNSQLAAIEIEIAAEEQTLAPASRAARAARSEASERLTAAQAAARQVDDQLGRLRQLDERGLVAQADLAHATAEAERRRAEVSSARLSVERIDAQLVASEREQRAHLGARVRERVALEGQRAAAMAAVTRREREAEERLIRAAVDGRLGEIAPLQVGAVIREGEHLASIVPDGRVKIVAEFLPPALGHVRAGRGARLRLDGFSWTQYGHVPATVRSVASEPRDGRVRVELTVDDRSPSPIPLEHGLPGVVEVEVERVAPVALLIRTLGRAVTMVDAPESDPASHPTGQ
jgi:multidrug resistance efflux pump